MLFASDTIPTLVLSGIGAGFVALAAVVSKLWLDLRILAVQEKDCQVSLARTDERLQSAIKQLNQLQAIVFAQQPATAPVATVTTDEDGVIRNIDAGVTVLLHYTYDELIGQNVDMLIPPRLRPLHHIGMEKVKASRAVLGWSQVVKGFALMKDGHEMPAIINVSAFQSGQDHWLYTATISRRPSA